MSSTVSIIMYHYVREIKNSRYPDIKGLSNDNFREQLKYIKKHYNVIGADELLGAVASGAQLPPKAILLTFDDGYIDHFTNVFPILEKERVPGCFFPSVAIVLEHKLLDVNKIHFILASVKDKSRLCDDIFSMLDEFRSSFQLRDNDHYWKLLGIADPYDPKEVIFIKRILQRELPEQLRRQITDALFAKYVSSDEASFAMELYMSLDQLVCMNRNGMYIGGHGHSHYWLDTLGVAEQEREIDLSVKFLDTIGSPTDGWIMCYPYGAYNDSLFPLLAARGCRVALSVDMDIADLKRDNPLALPRLDTNDLPVEENAAPNRWTLRAMSGEEALEIG